MWGIIGKMIGVRLLDERGNGFLMIDTFLSCCAYDLICKKKIKSPIKQTYKCMWYVGASHFNVYIMCLVIYTIQNTIELNNDNMI